MIMLIKELYIYYIPPSYRRQRAGNPLSLSQMRCTQGMSCLLKNLCGCFRLCRLRIPSPPFSFVSQTKVQAALGGVLLLASKPSIAVLTKFVICLIIVLGRRYVHIARVGIAEKTEFVNCNLPA